MVNISFLNQKIEEQFKGVDAFAKAIGLTKQAVYSWLRSETMPDESRVFDIVEALSLSEVDIDTLMGIPTTHVAFRTKGLAEPEPDVKGRSISLAETFFKIDGSSYVVKEGILTGIGESEPAKLVSYIRGLLDIEVDEPLRFEDLLLGLKKYNVNVFFLPFKKLGLSRTTSSRREVAFVARKGDRVIIFIDTERTIDQATWDICHELSHLIMHNNADTPEEERICNQVAKDLIYPTAFFKKHEDVLNVFVSAKKYSSPMMNEIYHRLDREFDWSPMGLALALEGHGYIADQSFEKKRLMMLNSAVMKTRKNIDKIFFSNFDPTNNSKFNRFFNEDIQANKEVFKPLLELRDAATFGKLSPRRLAEILMINSGDADELVRSWMEKQEAEVCQDDENEHNKQRK
jgi:hypothetical protein